MFMSINQENEEHECRCKGTEMDRNNLSTSVILLIHADNYSMWMWENPSIQLNICMILIKMIWEKYVLIIWKNIFVEESGLELQLMCFVTFNYQTFHGKSWWCLISVFQLLKTLVHSCWAWRRLHTRKPLQDLHGKQDYSFPISSAE